MHTNTHTASWHFSALRRTLAAILLAGMSWQQIHVDSIAFAITPDAALLQVEVEVRSEDSTSSISSALSSTGGIVPVFSASLITADSMESPGTSSGTTIETGSTLVPDTQPSDTPDFSDVHHAAPEEIPSSSTLVDTPENTHPTFEVEKQAEIQSAEELEQRLTVTLVSPSGKELDADVTIAEEQGGYVLRLEPPANFEPGKYHIEATLDENRGTTRALQRLFRTLFQNEEDAQILFEQDFTWGVLAFNPDHSSFLPGETARIAMAVLDDGGRTLCTAQIHLTVTAPDGTRRTLSTDDNSIVKNPDCKDKDVTYIPDYRADVTLDTVGLYTFYMEATTRNGVRTMSKTIAVEESRLLDVYRSSATRIYPLSDYEMKISVTPSHSFVGSITETIPNSLRIVKTDPPAAFLESDEETGLTTITWGDRLWEAGTVYDLRYQYDPPDISPEFYLTGPVRAEGTIMRPLDPPVQAEEPVISLLDEQTMTGITLHGSAEEEGTDISPFFSDVQPSGSVVPGFEDVTAGTSTGTDVLSSSSESSSASEETIMESSSSASGTINLDSSSGAYSSSEVSLSETSSVSSEEPPIPTEITEPSAESDLLSWIVSFLTEQSFAENGYDALQYEEPRQWQIASDSISNITGKVMTKEGVSLGAGKIVTVSLSGSVAVGSGTTDAGGQFTITGVNLSDGGVITLYLDNQTEKAVTVTLGSGTTMTGINLIQNYLVIRNDSHSVSAVTDTHLKISTTNGDADVSAIISSATDSSVRMAAGKSMNIVAGTTFRPGGEVRVGSGITINGTFKMDTYPVNLSGSWIAQGAGSFTGSNTVVFDGSNASYTQFITSNSSTFSGVTVLGNNNKVATLTDALRLSGSLLLTGTTQWSTSALPIRVRGNVTIDNNGFTGGASTWTVGGNWRVREGYVSFSQGTAVVLTGSGQLFEGGGMNYGNITVQGVVTMSGSTNISDTASTKLTINTGATMRIASAGVGVNLYNSSLHVLQNATVTGGQLQIYSGASIPVQRGAIGVNYLSILGGFNGGDARIAPAKYESTYVTISGSNPSTTLRLGTGTTTFRTGDNAAFISSGTGSDLTLDTQTYNATLVLTGNAQFSQILGGNILCACGTNPLVFSGGTTQVFQAGNVSFKNIAVNKSAGDLLISENGEGQNITLSGGTLIIDNLSTFRVTRTLLVNASTTLSISTGSTLLMTGDNADVHVKQSGTITGSGVLNVGSGASISTMSGTIRNYSLSIGGKHTGAGNRIVAAKYNAAGTVIYTSDATTDFEFSHGTTTFNGSLYFNSTGGILSIKNNVTNPNLIVKGNMTTCTAYPACRGKIDWQKGTGVLTFTGGFIHTLQMSGASLEPVTIAKTNGYLVLVGTGSTTSMTVSRGEFRQSPGSLWDINGALTISRTSPTNFGQYSMSGGTLTLSGNLINTNGVFRATTGSVVLDGGNQTLSGSNAFYNLQKTVTSQKTLTLAAGKTQSVSGTLLLRGITGALLNLRSTVTGQQSKLNLEQGSGMQVIDHVNVQDNHANGQMLSCFIGDVYGEGCVDFGGNTNWNFGIINLAARTVLGGAILTGKTASYTVNGGPVIDSGVTNTASGVVLLSGSTLHQDDVITLYLDNNTEKGVSVYISSGASFYGLVYQDSLLMTSYSGSAMTNTALDAGDNNGDSDIASIYSVAGGELRVKTGKYTGIIDGIYRPGGSVRLGGPLYIQSPFEMQSNAVTLSGSWLTLEDGSFSGTNTVTFDQSVGAAITSNGSHFHNLTLDPHSFSNIGPLDNLSISGSLVTMTGSGIFDANYKNIRVEGNTTLRSTGTYMRGTWSVDGNWNSADSTALIGSGSTLIMHGSGSTFAARHLSQFDNITIANNVTETFEAASDEHVVLGTLLISPNKTLTAGNGKIVVSSNAGDVQVQSNARIGGIGALVINSGSSISVMSGTINTAALAVYDQHIGNGNRIAAARYDSSYVLIRNNSGSLVTTTQEFSPGTTTFSGNVILSGTAGPLHMDLSQTNPHLVFLGSVILDDEEFAVYPLTWTWGDYPFVFSGSNLQIANFSGATLQDITVDKASNYLVLAGTGASIRHFVMGHGGFTQYYNPLTIRGTLSLSGGVYLIGGGTLTLSGNLMNLGGTVTDSTGSVILNGTDQKLFGSNSFYNLTKIASGSGQYLVLDAETQTVNGLLTLQGSASGDVLTIISGGNSYFNLTSGGSQIVDHVAVMNNIASGQQIVCYTATEGCVDNGGNSNWLFAPVTSSSSSAPSGNDQGPGGRRDDSIDRQIEEITGTSASVLLSLPPDPPAGCTVKLMEFKLGGAEYFLTFEGNVMMSTGDSPLQTTIESPVTPGNYIAGIYYAGIHDHKSGVQVTDEQGNLLASYNFSAQNNGENYARKIDYATDRVRRVRFAAGTEYEMYHWIAAYMCPLSLHAAPGDVPPGQAPGDDFTVPEFPIIDPVQIDRPIDQSPIPGLDPDDFIIDNNGNIISVNGQFLIDRDGNILRYDDLIRSVTGSLLLKQMRSLHFASLLKQGGLTLFYKPLTAEQLELLRKLLKRPLVSVVESDFLPNAILEPLIEEVMRNPTEENWQTLMDALTPDVAEKGTVEPTPVSIIGDAISRSFRELASFLRTAGHQISDYVLGFVGFHSYSAIPLSNAPATLYESKLRPSGSTSELAVFHLRFVTSYGEPLSHVPVVLFSIPKFTTTDNDGIATFFDVPAGVHRLEAHLDDGRVETRMVTIRPPTNVRLTESVDTILPLAEVVVPEPNVLRTDPDVFPPLALLLLAMIIGGNVYMQIRRRRKKKNDDQTSADTTPTVSEPPQTPGISTTPSL